jgi:hypothetical protein
VYLAQVQQGVGHALVNHLRGVAEGRVHGQRAYRLSYPSAAKDERRTIG